MSTFRYAIQLGDFAGSRFELIGALVDIGATYTSVPSDILADLGVRPAEERPFILANGQRVGYGVAWVRIRLDEREAPTLVIFGDVSSEALLGAVTLEEFGLAVDPLNRRLVPVPGYLVGVQEGPS